MNQRLLLRLLWPVAAAVVTTVFALARLAGDPRFYFADDTQLGSFGQWWQLGDQLRQGRLPILEPSAWQAGNYLAEGQWGLFSPLTWLIALGARASEDPVVFATIVKVLFLVLLSLGTYVLARSFTAARAWAALSAVLVPLCGFTVYMDAASWSTGLFNAALLPWVWWALRRAVEASRSPIPYLIASYLLVSFGYVFGVIALVAILVESLVRAIWQRDRDRIVRSLLASAWGAAWTVLVYLPGILTASVTPRGDFVVRNWFFLNADLTDVAGAASPTFPATIRTWVEEVQAPDGLLEEGVALWTGEPTNAPLVYIAWLLPYFLLVLPLSRAALRRCIPLLVLGSATFIAILAPSHIAAIRWPLRFIPYVALTLLVLFAVAATRTRWRELPKSRIRWTFALIVVLAVLNIGNVPLEWRSVGATAVAQLILLAAIVFVARRPWREAVRTAVMVTGAVAVTAATVAAQIVAMPRTPLPGSAVPDVSTMRQVLSEPRGDAIAVGNINAGAGDPATWDERLVANLWYLSETDVSNLYTVLPYDDFVQDLCMDLRGNTCADALDTLWSTDRETGERLSDLMGISTVLAMKATFPDQPQAPAGWHLEREGEFTWLFQRDEPLPAAGGVVWTGDGTALSEIEVSDGAVSFRVDEAGADGRVVLSRLDYPGYAISGAVKGDAVRDWLLTVEVSGAAPGDVVTVRFQPPGMPLLVAAASLGVLVAAGWLLLRLVSRRRAARPTTPAATRTRG
ncbi:hypothetical protein [Microbacterium sp. JZ31]|uniref:hypothetical protein n=1 Tax=Microbacterium sp. JZ31 TaxID=1906274 RepID=UPI001931A91A|nr:hypothetical protein [Microbacterium sp. JZ31]